MRIRQGKLRLSPNEEALLIKEETEKRRKLRLQQVREQSKENAAKIRHAVKQEKHRQLMKLANEIKGQLEEEKAERVRHLERQYDNSLRNIGVGHKHASEQPDWGAERELIQQAENLRAEARGRSAIEKEKRELAEKRQEARKHVVARKNALEVEKQRSAEIAAMPPPPPDPIQNLNIAKPKAVKVMDMEHFATSHYHLQNEHVIDKAGPEEQEDAREAAEVEAERIKDRALELKRLRQDQLERARLRHNQALERELLKHDYNNILHDLSDLQREDRERRLKIVHNIPKQVFEPPTFRMDDRDDKQRQMEQDFEDMYMAGTDYQGDINMTLGPKPHPGLQVTDDSLDVTLTENGTPIREPTLPGVPPVLKDMTNMPRAKSPGKRPEKVLRSLMDKIKTQREGWINSQTMMEVGDATQQDDYSRGEFVEMVPEESSVQGNQGSHGQPPADPQLDREMGKQPAEFPTNHTAPNERQMLNGQINPEPMQQGQPFDLQQIELAQIIKQQELILEQKQQLERKLQQLSQEQRKLEMPAPMSGPTVHGASQPQSVFPQQPATIPTTQVPHIYQNGLPKQQSNVQLPLSSVSLVSQQDSVPAQQQRDLNQQRLYQQQQELLAQQQQQQLLAQQQQQMLAQQHEQLLAQQQHQQVLAQQQHQQVLAHQQQQQFVSSLSSSGMSSQHPMNSIPPTGTTSSVPMATMAQSHSRSMRSAYQPPSAVLTTDQLGVQSQPQQYSVHPAQLSHNATNMQNGFNGNTLVTSSYPSMHHASMTTDLTNLRASVPGHVTPGSLTSDTHNSQMQKIREYQQQLLMRHEQSKKVLEETKAEIKKRRENLMQRYPKLDLSRLEDLGAKYLENGVGQQPSSVQTAGYERNRDQSQVNDVTQGSVRAGQGSGVPVTQLLASLASHPYYKATLSQPGAGSGVNTGQAPPATHITIGSVHIAQPNPDMDENMNLKKNKLDGVRKSLPFDSDESFQIKTPVRVYEAYAQKHQDSMSGADQTDTSAFTDNDKDSPAFRIMSAAEDTDVDTTLSGSFLSDKKDPPNTRQDELRQHLLEIQRQKEEIIKKHKMGQQKLQQKEYELKQKLASVVTKELPENGPEKKDQVPLQTSQADFRTDDPQRQHNLSTILEMDTPSSARPSDTGRLSNSSSDSGSFSFSDPMRRFQDQPTLSQHRGRVEVITEEPRLEEVETQMQKQKQTDRTEGKGGQVAEYSGKHIDNVLERAKRFETEVLEKLRKQTNAVLFDNEYDDSLEFNTSQRQERTEKPSSGESETDSFSTGPLEDTSVNRSLDPSQKSASSSKTWADELSQYKLRNSGQSDNSFKQMLPENDSGSTGGKHIREDTIFSGDVNRFNVYSKINDSDHSDVSNTSSDLGIGKGRMVTSGGVVNADDMLGHLRELQKQLKDEGEAREALAKRLDEVQHQTASTAKSFDANNEDRIEHDVSRPFMSDASRSDLSQYTITDKSADTSVNDSSKVKTTYDSPIQSGTSSKEREIPVRRSPIGDAARSRSESPALAGSHHAGKKEEVTSTEYSFGMEDSKQRSTSTPGDDRRKSSLGMSTVNKSELPSAITVGEKTASQSVRFSSDLKPSRNKEVTKSTELSSDLSSHTISSFNDSSKFAVLTPEKTNDNTGAELTTYSLTSAEDSLHSMKEQFQRLVPIPAQRQNKIKTYAVSRDGDLISEQSDSDRSSGNFLHKTDADFTTYSLSTQGGGRNNETNDTNSTNYPLSSFSMNDQTKDDKRLSQLSEYTIKSSAATDTSPRSSNPQSSSFTNITSDPSFNASSLSQYTVQQDGSGSMSLDRNENNNLQQKFANLDNLIHESKSLIARHKVIIDKNKQAETEMAPPIPTSLPPPLKRVSNGRNSGDTLEKAPRQKQDEVKQNDDSKLSQHSSLNDSNKSGNQSSRMNYKNFEYLTEHSSGITEETMPELSNMTLGSELSISEAFNKTELSDSGDSLQSFEKHELSESESLSASRSSFYGDGKTDLSRSDASTSLQDIVEARKHNFMVQSERVAAAAKERALSQRNKPEQEEHPVFRAVPVNVVAAPKLSMSMNGQADKGSIPTTLQMKAANTENDVKKGQDDTDKETSSPTLSKLPLNRALQPRGWESPRQPDSPEAKVNEKASTMNSRTRELSGASLISRSISAPASTGNKALIGEIKKFGGATGLAEKAQTPSPAKKTPPKVLPKPVRSKIGFAPGSTADGTSSKKPAAVSASSGFSKTLSSWKKSRAVTTKSAIPEPVQRNEALKNSIRVLPKEAPTLLTEEEKRQKMEEELYEKNIRAYNPRLFRLQHRLDTTDEADTSQEKPSGKPKEIKRDTASSIRR